MLHLVLEQKNIATFCVPLTLIENICVLYKINDMLCISHILYTTFFLLYGRLNTSLNK